MKWFEGSINEAVAASKAKKAIFVVFVGGNDDASLQVSQAIESSEISSRLEQDNFVAVRIESGSETYRFFAQIYQLVPVPSVFFIGETGVPLEIVAGSTTASELGTKIDEVLAKSGKSASGSSLSFIQSEKKSAESTSATVTTEIPSVSNTQGESKKDEKKAAELSHEEKVKRAQELMELQKKQRVEEEMRKEKEREIERRRREKEVQELRLKQRDMEIKQSQEERLREKAADAAARERVRQQIAQDKLMRKEREQALQQTPSQQQPEKQTTTPCSTEVSLARIQFRLPTGSTHMGQFEPLCTLGSLRNYVVRNIELPFQQFAMSTSFPRRDLLSEDDSKSLRDLGLVPTAVILILPLRNPNAKSVVTSSEEVGFLSRLIWNVFTPIIGVYNYVLRYFYGQNGSSAPDRQQEEAADSSESATTADGNIPRNSPNMQQPSGLHRRNVGTEETKVIRTQGNIHRLHSARDDNDENNTWNGNSTQQM